MNPEEEVAYPTKPNHNLERVNPVQGFFRAKVDPRALAIFRIAVALLLLINVYLLAPYFELWFTDQGLVPWDTSIVKLDLPRFNLFALAPHSTYFAFSLFVLHVLAATALLFGFYTRAATVLVFVTLVSIHTRNIYILNSGDTVLRLICFLLMFSEAGAAYSWDAKKRSLARKLIPVWPLHLMQLQIATVYFSTVLWKLKGTKWWDGTAVYYVSQLQEFQRFPVGPIFDWIWSVRFFTWSTLLIELALATLIWFKRLRPWVLLLAFGFHLGLEYTMNIQLFQWIMIASLILFIDSSQWPWRQDLADEN